MLEGGGACGRNLVLLPLRRQIPARLAGQMLRDPRRPHLQPAAGALGKAHSAHQHLVDGVAIGEVVAKVKRDFAPRPLLPLRAIEYEAPIPLPF